MAADADERRRREGRVPMNDAEVYVRWSWQAKRCERPGQHFWPFEAPRPPRRVTIYLKDPRPEINGRPMTVYFSDAEEWCRKGLATRSPGLRHAASVTPEEYRPPDIPRAIPKSSPRIGRMALWVALPVGFGFVGLLIAGTIGGPLASGAIAGEGIRGCRCRRYDDLRQVRAPSFVDVHSALARRSSRPPGSGSRRRRA